MTTIRRIGPAPRSLTDLWEAARDLGSARPFLTYYDDATGERTELSYATTDNWLSKTANLIQDEVAGAVEQPRVAILLPAHWITVVWLLATFRAGCVAVTAGGVADTDLVIAEPNSLAAARECQGERFATALLPFGRGFERVPDGFRDFGTEALAHPDTFIPYLEVKPDMPALLTTAGDGTITAVAGGEACERARAMSREWRLDENSRLLTDRPLTTHTDILAGLLAPLAAGGSLVICRNSDSAKIAGRVAAERVTARLIATEQHPATVVPVGRTSGRTKLSYD